MRIGSIARTRSGVTATLLGMTALLAARAFAVPIPPANFTYVVSSGGSILVGCVPGVTSVGGTCGSEGSSPGYAATSGGIGTASYLPVTPGGTVLGSGTAVDAISTWTSGAGVVSNAVITYSFEATGPADVDYIPIDVLSTGLLSASGDGTAHLTLVISDSGTDANIPPGVPDSGPATLLKLTASCAGGSCISDWYTPDESLSDAFCVVNGDNYTITIDATTSAGPGAGDNNSASAVLDPRIILDPPYPTVCNPAVPLNQLGVDTGPGASTGFLEAAVPEPSGLSLAALGVLGLAGLGLGRRRCGA